MDIRETLDHVYGDNLKRAKWGRRLAVDTSLSVNRPSAEFLYRFVRQRRPGRCLEVGMAWGFSSVPICAALRDSTRGQSIIVDPFQWTTYEAVGCLLLREHKLSRFAKLVAERSDTFLPKLFARGHELDFAFIDGDHRIDATFVDFYYINKMLRVGGVVIFDDVQFGSVRSVVEYALKNFHYQVVEQPIRRFAVLERTREDDRDWSAYGGF